MMEAEKTNLLLKQQERRVLIQRQNTEIKQAIIKAKGQLEVSHINSKKQIQEKMNQYNMSLIENQVFTEREKANIDAQYY